MAYSDCRPRRRPPPLRQRQRQHQRRRLLHVVDVVSSLKMMAIMRTMMIMMAVVFVLVLVERQQVPVQVVAAFSFSPSSSSSSSLSLSSFYSSRSSRKIKTTRRRTGDSSLLSTSFSSTSLSMSSQQQQPSFILHVDDSTTLTTGTLVLPPMVSVPCTITTTATATTDVSLLTEIIKPPNVDELYDWYIDVRKETDADPSWGVVWPTAIALCHYLLLNPTLVQNKNVIELGSGLSVCGLVAASIGAINVIVSDREQFALHCALSSAACNKISRNVFQGVILDWCDTQNTAELDHTADIILASDVLYDMETVDAFANVCQRLLVLWNTTTSTSTSTTTSNNNKNGTAAAAATITGTILVTDPKIERTIGARERFKKTLFKLLNNNNNNNDDDKDDDDHNNNSGVITEIEIEEIDLPLPCVTTNNNNDGSGSGSGRTFDGKDHTKRMKEETVLIRCTIRTTTNTTNTAT